VPWTLWMWRRRPAFLPLLVIACVLYVVWFNGTQVARLLLPALVLLAVPAADAVLAVWDRVRVTRLPIAMVLAASVILAVGAGALRFTRFVTDPGGFVGRQTDYYDAIQWMNTHLDPKRHRVATDLRAPAYLAIPWMNLSGNYQVEIAEAEQKDPQQFQAALLRQGFTHVYGMPSALGDPPDWLEPVYSNPDSLEGGTHLLRTPPTGPITVYAIR